MPDFPAPELIDQYRLYEVVPLTELQLTVTCLSPDAAVTPVGLEGIVVAETTSLYGGKSPQLYKKMMIGVVIKKKIFIYFKKSMIKQLPHHQKEESHSL